MNSFTVNGQAANGVALAAFTGIIIAISVAIFVLLVIAYWKMFTKAGEKGWKSIIPIYNEYVAFRLAWKGGTKNFLIFLIAGLVAYVPSSAVGASGTDVTADMNPVLAIVILVAAIICLVWYIRFLVKQAHAYNKGVGCAILTLLFPNIMTLYYGFAKSATYQGPQD